jgi:SsrA-binding protein
MAKQIIDNRKIIAQNRKARFNYSIEDTYEAGIVLLGSEVKSVRVGQINIEDSHASITKNELVLYNANIPEYGCANRFNHNTKRPRKLLMHRKEINKLLTKIKIKGYTLIALSIYFNKANKVKVEIGLARGNKEYDKRHIIKERDWQRDKSREMMKRS